MRKSLGLSQKINLFFDINIKIVSIFDDENYQHSIHSIILINMNSSFLDSNISQFIIRYNGEVRQQPTKKVTAKLISASSDFQIKHHKKKVRRLDCSEVASIEKNTRKHHGHSVHTNADEKKEEKQFSRVPIEYAQERDQGNPADKVRGRVVYRGYAPKNTYFYLKTIKQLNVANNNENRQDRDFRGEDVIFNSKFESGNLNAAVRINSREYWLYMRQDTNTHGLRQWFYFELKVRKNCRLRLRIYKFSKRFSLYKIGMKPFVRTRDGQWRQEGQKVRYQYDTDQKCFFLQFQYQFQQYKETYFATLPPYTCTHLSNYLDSLATQEKVSIKRIGQSLSGFDIMSINIICRKSHRAHDKEREQKEKIEVFMKSHDKTFHGHTHAEKDAIIVLARTHPGQTVSNFALESFISRVLQTPTLTDHYNFYIVPMVNPDGVFLGNHRTGVLGQDLNRNFHAADLQFFPQVQTVENFIISVQKRHKVAFLFDLHGHSAKKNIFAYGDEAESGSSKYLYGRIIPKILSNLIGSFRYDHCVFKAAKQKKNTARVYFSNKNGINAVTFEQSYGLLEVGNIGIINWRNFGTALADSLITFLSFSKENINAEMTNYLQDQMDKQKAEIQNKKQRKLQKERAKIRIISQTQINQDMAAKASVHDFLKKMKGQKSEMAEKCLQVTELAQYEQRLSSNNEDEEQQELSSGDEDLQMQNFQLQAIKKDIVRVGIQNRQSYKRELYSMAQKKVELGQHYVVYSQRLHHKQSSMAQRIFKFRSRQKHRDSQGLPNSFSYRQKGQSIQLPYIRK